MLPKVRGRVGAAATLIVDGGILSGGDALVAVALGADAAMVGRGVLWGLALAGATGAEWVLDVILAEFRTELRLLGCLDVGSIRNVELVEGHPWSAPR